MTRSVDAGYLESKAFGRTGRVTRLPPQFEQTKLNLDSAHLTQNVHSNEQIKAPLASGGKSLSHASQFGRICNIEILPGVGAVECFDLCVTYVGW